MSKHKSRKCGVKKCRAWAMRHSGPPRCSAHQEDDGPHVGAPPGNKNRMTHGFYSQPARDLRDIDDVLDDLMSKQSQLSAYIESKAASGDIEAKEMIKLMHLHASTASRLGRLLRDQRALAGLSADGLLDAIGAALDELSTELGIEL